MRRRQRAGGSGCSRCPRRRRGTRGRGRGRPWTSSSPAFPRRRRRRFSPRPRLRLPLLQERPPPPRQQQEGGFSRASCRCQGLPGASRPKCGPGRGRKSLCFGRGGLREGREVEVRERKSNGRAAELKCNFVFSLPSFLPSLVSSSLPANSPSAAQPTPPLTCRAEHSTASFLSPSPLFFCFS